MLAATGDSPKQPIPVAIATPRGLLVAALRASGRLVYSINPLAVARYRERTSVTGKKSDHADAMVLANILRTDKHLHRALPADTELARSIAVLARASQDATWRRTRARTGCAHCCASTTRPSCRPSPAGPVTSPTRWPALSWSPFQRRHLSYALLTDANQNDAHKYCHSEPLEAKRRRYAGRRPALRLSLAHQLVWRRSAWCRLELH